MIDLKLIYKGMLVGLAKIIPGVSGSLLAVSLGIYTIAIEAISHPFRNFKQNIIFLGNVGIGVVVSISLCSGIVSFFLNKYFFLTVILFMGFIVGTFPQLFKEANVSSKNDWLLVIGMTVFVFLLSSFKSTNEFIYENSLLNNLFVFLFGFIDAAAMVIPGISGTAIFLLIGCYPFILKLFASLPTIFMNPDFICYISFGLGLFTGIIVVSKIMNYILKSHEKKTYLCITSFAISSILLLCVDLFSISITCFEFIVGIFLFVIGYKISSFLNI